MAARATAPAWARSRRFRPDEVAMLQRKPGHMQRGRKSRRGLALQLRRAGHNVVRRRGVIAERRCKIQNPSPDRAQKGTCTSAASAGI